MKKMSLLWAAIIAGCSLCTLASAQSIDRVAAIRLPGERTMPSLRATQWLNSEPLSPADLRGKVVLVDFWTYTCINWLRTLPYVRAWSEKYKEQGLVVIGVHTPEFEFEKDLDNVMRATRSMNIQYPVAVDSDYAIWRAFDNDYWPALYVIDANGKVRHHKFGEGDYEQAERIIQQLLGEAGASNVDRNLVSVTAQGAEVAADWRNLKSPENYLGYQRTDNFASTTDAVLDKSHHYAPPARLRLNYWALAGQWTMQKQATRSNQPRARILYRFHARDVHIVMGPAQRGAAVRFQVRIDGKPPGESHGSDVDDQGRGVVAEQRLYQLIRQPQPGEDHDLEIEFLDAGVEAFAFTFG